jgi:hypothetical protein
LFFAIASLIKNALGYFDSPQSVTVSVLIEELLMPPITLTDKERAMMLWMATAAACLGCAWHGLEK